MGGTFLCHIPSLEGSVWLEGRRLGSRSQGEAGELGMICLVTGGQYFVLTDGWRHLISEMRAIWSGTDEVHGIRDFKSRFNDHQQCINSYGSVKACSDEKYYSLTAKVMVQQQVNVP